MPDNCVVQCKSRSRGALIRAVSGHFHYARPARTDELKATEMGRKAGFPIGLYRLHGFVSAHLSHQTKFTDEDLNLLFRALCGRASEPNRFNLR